MEDSCHIKIGKIGRHLRRVGDFFGRRILLDLRKCELPFFIRKDLNTYGNFLYKNFQRGVKEHNYIEIFFFFLNMRRFFAYRKRSLSKVGCH